MHADFAYSLAMQWILLGVSTASTALCLWCSSMLALNVYGHRSPPRRYIVAVVSIGTVINQMWMYSLLFFNGMQVYDEVSYALITTVNPTYALLFYITNVKVLHYSPYRSMHLMRLMLLFTAAVKQAGDFFGTMFFAQTGGRYNFLLDALAVGVFMLVCVMAYVGMYKGLKRSQFLIRVKEATPMQHLPRQFVLSVMQLAAIYTWGVLSQLAFEPKALGYLLGAMVLGLCIAQIMLAQYNRTLKNEIDNKQMHMHLINEAIEELSSVRHEFYNVLQTYSGYIALGDNERLKAYNDTLKSYPSFTKKYADLALPMQQNPAIAGQVTKMAQRAKRYNVRAQYSIQTDISDMGMDNAHLCRALDLLFNAAVDSAAGHAQRRVSVGIQRREDGAMLITLSFSAQPQGGKGAYEAARDQLMRVQDDVICYARYQAGITCIYIQTQPGSGAAMGIDKGAQFLYDG